jgi:hypothetical protein
MASGRLSPNVLVILLLGASLAGCDAPPRVADSEPVPSRASPPRTPAGTGDPTTSAAFPSAIDPGRRYLFYLHGKIIEDQGLPAVSAEFGEYRYEAILEALQSHGFVVISEIRPRDADRAEWARRIAGQVTDLLDAGVPPGFITVVGASKGAAIAVLVSELLANADLNYVLLGSCHPSLIDEWIQQGVTVSGNVLAIYDSSDDEYAGSCEQLFALSEDNGLSRHDEIVLQVGTGHGILYEPLAEWVEPTVEWAVQDW